MSINQLLKGPMRDVWYFYLDNELGQLADGLSNELIVEEPVGFIFEHQIPKYKKIKNANILIVSFLIVQLKLNSWLSILKKRLSIDSEWKKIYENSLTIFLRKVQKYLQFAWKD